MLCVCFDWISRPLCFQLKTAHALLFLDVSAPKDTPGSVPENQESSKWFTSGVKLIKENLNKKPIIHTAKNTILFLGDGMSVTTVTATRILEGQMRNQSGEENVLSWEQFPWTALSKTFNVDQQVPDSAGTATAYLEGVKTDAGRRVLVCAPFN